MRAALERGLLARWYGRPGWLLLLLPLAWIYRGVAFLREFQRVRTPPPVPVIVVGNITVGGSGKTPLVLWLVSALRARGLRVGVLARGYGGSGPFPLVVHAGTSPAQCGDEPALIARSTGVPVVVDPDRVRALGMLVAQGVDVVISDDGLQHVALPRSVEIAVVDDQRRLGNGYCLPVGPLREPAVRLQKVDFVVGNGGDAGVGAVVMQLVPAQFHGVADPQFRQSAAEFRERHGAHVAAVAGIGNPSRFFATLRAMGFTVDEFPFPDHHAFGAGDFHALAGRVVVMTAKDAVKCREIAGLSAFYLAVEASLPDSFLDDVLMRAGLTGRR